MNILAESIKKLFSKPVYSPNYNPIMARAKAIQTATDLWAISSHHASTLWEQHETFVEEQRYSDEITNGKTLSFDESFFIYILMVLHRPRTIVEIGTQYGRSTRRIIDMSKALALNSRIVCYDIADEVVFFNKGHEAELRICDITPRFYQEVIDSLKPDIVFLDARPRPLIEAVVSGCLNSTNQCVLAIHDCARGICRQDTSSMPLTTPTSITGIWERHVLAAAFAVTDPLSDQLDSCDKLGVRLRILNTRHGLAFLGKASCFSSSRGNS